MLRLPVSNPYIRGTTPISEHPNCFADLLLLNSTDQIPNPNLQRINREQISKRRGSTTETEKKKIKREKTLISKGWRRPLFTEKQGNENQREDEP
jgi:hypothetical protein